MATNRGGRPTVYSAEVQYRICVHLGYGATLKIAAESEGIAESTAYSWLESKPAFLSAVTEAKALARSTYLRNMALAANRGNVEACKWMLERLEPDVFAPPAKRLEVKGAVDHTLTQRQESLDDAYNRLTDRAEQAAFLDRARAVLDAQRHLAAVGTGGSVDA